MFDLEQAITEWRRQMLAAGIKAPEPLGELESHLCEDVERQISSGSNAQQAFGVAVRRIGEAAALKAEFANADFALGARLVQLMGIACVSIACAFSLWISANLFHHGVSLTAKLVGLAGAALTGLSCRCGHRFLPAIRDWRFRAALGILCCLASVFWMMLFITLIVPRLFDVPAGSEFPMGRLLVSFQWAWAATAVLGGMAYGLEKAARRYDGQYV